MNESEILQECVTIEEFEELKKEVNSLRLYVAHLEKKLGNLRAELQRRRR